MAFVSVTRLRVRSFMRSGAHRRVMPHLAKWCDEESRFNKDSTSELRPPD
jgi:hypothetical protein